MPLRQLERWKAHFRYRKELNPDEWVPISDRQLTIDDVRERSRNAAAKIEAWGM